MKIEEIMEWLQQKVTTRFWTFWLYVLIAFQGIGNLLTILKVS